MRNQFESLRIRTADRRRVLQGATAALAGMAGARMFNASAQATPETEIANGVQPDGSWAFLDDRGILVTTPSLPDVIVAQTTAASSLYDFGVLVDAIYGPTKSADGVVDFQAGNLPVDDIVVLGDWGAEALELDMEAFVGLSPDLVVDMALIDGSLWYLAGDSLAQVEATGTPTLGINLGTVTLKTIISRMEELAVALGADVEDAAVVDAKSAFESAEERLVAAIAAKPDLSVVVLSANAESVWIASPRFMTDLMYFQELGLNIIDHDGDDFFEQISWEVIIDYSADVVLVDARPGNPTPDELAETAPLWNSLPAVVAGQVGPWYAAAPVSYGRFAPIMDELSAIVESADESVVSS